MSRLIGQVRGGAGALSIVAALCACAGTPETSVDGRTADARTGHGSPTSPGASSPPVQAATPPPAPPANPPRDSAPPPRGEAEARGMREVFPHVRIDAAARVVELEGRVPIVVDDTEAPVVYLELIACIPDTKEHEVLVVTRARPSHVHAALLLIGLEPGRPGWWEWIDDELVAHPASGDAVIVELVRVDESGREVVEPAWSWVKSLETGETFPEGEWLFAGSRMVDRGPGGAEMYDADGAGTLIGLTTFGSETIAWPEMISHEAAVEQPVWIADVDRVPPVDTPVTIRLRPGG